MMKILNLKISLLSVGLLIGTVLIAQTQRQQYNLQKGLTEASKEYIAPEVHPEMRPFTPLAKATATTSYGTAVGTSYYDLQSNGPSNHNIALYDDGSVAIVYTSNDNAADPVGPLRGAGYAYYNATTQAWSQEAPAQFGIFDTRVGWPQIGNSANGELVIAHRAAPTTMVGITRAIKGSGAWSSSIQYISDEYLWPRMAVVGDTVHLIGSCNTDCTSPSAVASGLTNMMWYSRSTDGGQTFDITQFALPGCDTSNFQLVPYSSGPTASLSDSYSIDAVGNTVAIVAGGGPDSFHGWKSVDGGSTWQFIPIADHSFADTANGQGYIGVTATNDTTIRIFHPGNDPEVVIDNNGVMHVFSGAIEQSWAIADTTWNGRAPGSGIMYWNENMIGQRPRNISEMLMDIDCDGNLNYNLADEATGSYGIDNGATIGATASVDANGNLFVIASSVVEGEVDIIRLSSPTADSVWIRDLYLLYSTDGGGTWSYPINVASQLAGYTDGLDSFDIYKGARFTEESYPTVVKHVGADNKLHVYFQADNAVGTFIGGTTPFQPAASINTQTYVGLDVATILGTSGFNTDSCELNYITGLSLEQKIKSLNVFPNPATNQVSFSLSTRSNATVTINIVDLLGRTIKSDSKKIEARNETLSLDISSFEKGLYFYKIESEGEVYSGKFLKE